MLTGHCEECRGQCHCFEFLLCVKFRRCLAPLGSQSALVLAVALEHTDVCLGVCGWVSLCVVGGCVRRLYVCVALDVCLCLSCSYVSMHVFVRVGVYVNVCVCVWHAVK